MPRKKVKKTKASKPRSSFPIVGVGASAGGIESFSEFLSALPSNTGMAFVLVQHLAPKHKSLLAEIFQTHTQMPVSQAANGMRVEPNHVYIIAPNTKMGIAKGRLVLSLRPTAGPKFMPIDYFFESLAKDQGENAVAVIMSGADADGVEGLKHIRGNGGLAFAQKPDTARVPEMPSNAIAEGNVDRVLAIPQLAAEIVALSKNGESANKSSLIDKESVKQIQELLLSRTSTDFSHYKEGTFTRRLQRRMHLRGCLQLRDYASLLAKEPKETTDLFADLLINITSFFRDSDVFAGLNKKVFVKLFERQPPNSSIRVWVPGCSTGEEAYSILICMLEAMEEQNVRFPVQVFATDISDDVLEKARGGVYPHGIAALISPERLRRYFTRVPEGFRVSAMLREQCVFAKHNMTKDPPFSRMDLISCRNLLIYFDGQLQKYVVGAFAYALSPGGFLVLGNSESPTGGERYFNAVDKKSRIYQRSPQIARLHYSEGIQHFQMPGSQFPSKPLPGSRDGFEQIEREADRIVLSRYGPPGVIINEHMQIVKFRGHTGEILEHGPGVPDLNLFNMARGGLGHELLVLIKQAGKEKTFVVNENVKLQKRKGSQSIGVRVYPLQPSAEGRHFLVLFEQASPGPLGKKTRFSEEITRGEKSSRKEFVKTKQELFATKEYLQSIITDQENMVEELKSANEEVLSSNEELQSTNEELETAKEELQSTNEELTTVNEELVSRNALLVRSKSDLSNLLASVDLAIVMVGNDLRIRMATPPAKEVMNIIDTDIGRPIGHIKPNVEMPELEKMIIRTIDTLKPIEVLVKGTKGAKYALRLRPYRTDDNKIDGAVLVFIEMN